MFGCVLSLLKPSALYILSCGKGRGLQGLQALQALSYTKTPLISMVYAKIFQRCKS